MAITQQEVVLTFTAETKQVTKELENVAKSTEDIAKNADNASKAIENTGDATGALTGQLDKLTGGAVSGFAAMKQGITSTIGGMKSLKLAIAATGIGALVVAVASLATAFTSSQEGAEKFRRILGVFGSVVDNLLDLVADLGEGIIAAFENPKEALIAFKDAIVDNIVNRFVGIVEFMPQVALAIQKAFKGDIPGALKTAADATAKVTLGVENYTDKVAESVQAAKDFTNQLIEEGKQADKIAQKRNRALVLERELITERAERESEIAALRLKSRQEEQFTAEERGQALRDAQVLEDSLLAKELELLTLRRDAQIEENKLARSSEENLDKEAQAIANVSRLEAARLNQQRQTQRELNRINKEIARDRKAEQAEQDALLAQERKRQEAEIAAQQKLEDELYALQLSAQEREELALLQAYDKRIAIAGDNEGLIKAATEQFLNDQLALQQKYNEIDQAEKDANSKKEIQRQQAVANSRIQLGLGALSALQQLNTAFQKDDEASAKKAFKRNKALSIATATLQTAQAVTAALTAGGNPIKLATGAQFVEAGIAAAMGAAQIATIAKQKFTSTSTNTGPSALETATSNISVPAVGSSGGGAGAGTSVGAPQLDLGFLGQGQTTTGPIQAYVISQNVTTAQQANQQIAEQAAL